MQIQKEYWSQEKSLQEKSQKKEQKTCLLSHLW